MKKCCVCQKKQIPGNGAFFAVPKGDRRTKWSQICELNFARDALVCMDHFTPSSYVNTGARFMLLPNAVPVMPIVNQMPATAEPYEMQHSLESSYGTGTNNCCSTQTVCDIPHHTYLLNMDESQFATEDIHFLVEGMQTDLVAADYLECDTPVGSYVTDGFYIMDDMKFDTKEIRFLEKETQTDPVAIERSFHSEKIRSLQNEIKDLKVSLAKANTAVDAMRSIFTEGQIRKLMSPSGFINWKWPDISNAICLQASGPRAYRHLYMKGFPLPHVTTLQRWCRKIDLSEGILRTAIEFMKQISDLEPAEKLCVLAFDEMKVMETFEYDRVADVAKTPVNYVQVVMARGLHKSWKQPVFYNYDSRMTTDILNSLIIELHKVGFPVVAIVCDMGPTNRKLWKELSISPDRPWFPNPISPLEKIFAFADAPHMLKLIRNHFLDTGLVVNNQLLTSQTFTELLKYTSSSDASITFKLTTEHLAVKGVGRQNVKMAAQLFSNTAASAIRRCYSMGMQLHNAAATADFVQLVNNWFDVHNSRLSTFAFPGKEPFGRLLDTQMEIISQMNAIMSNPIIPNKKSLEHFQKGILISNNALIMLLKYVSEKFSMSYICTNRLNQDILENFFGAIRSKGGLNDHPSPKDFSNRLRKYILARNTEQLSGTGNVANDPTEWLNKSSCNDSFGQYGIKEKIVPDLESDDEDEEDILGDLHVTSFHDIGTLQEDALEYISGYVIRKLNLEAHECHENSFTWVDQVSKGFLKKPSSSFLEKIKLLESVFSRLNGNEISTSPKLHKRLVKRSNDVKLEEKIKAFFFKCRIHFRVRHLNQRLKIQKAKQRMMGNKKLLKINL